MTMAYTRAVSPVASDAKLNGTTVSIQFTLERSLVPCELSPTSRKIYTVGF